MASLAQTLSAADVAFLKQKKAEGVDAQTAFTMLKQEHPAKKSQGLISSIVSGAKDVGIGALKGIGSTGVGIGQLLLTKSAEDKYGLTKAKESLKPTNTAQKIGFGIEQIAEFLVPASAGVKAAKILAGTKALRVLPKAARTIAAASAVEGAIGTGVAAAQQGKLDKSALITGALSAAIPVVGAGIQAIKKPAASALKSSAAQDIYKLLAPTKEVTKKLTAKITPQMLAKPQIALSRQGLLNKAIGQLDEVGEKIGDYGAKGNIKGKTDTSSILAFLRNEKKAFYSPGKGGAAVAIEPAKIKVIEEFEDTISQFGSVIPNSKLNNLRKTWDTSVKESKGFLKDIKSGTEIAVKKDLTNLFRTEIAKANPDLALLNKQYTFYSNLQDILEETLKRKVGQKDIVAKGGSMILGATLPGASAGVVERTLGAAGMSAFYSLIDSAVWRTLNATVKTRLADAILKGNTSTALEILKSLSKAAAKQQLSSATSL